MPDSALSFLEPRRQPSVTRAVSVRPVRARGRRPARRRRHARPPRARPVRSDRDARQQTELAGKGVIEPNLEPGIVQGRREARARLDRVVGSRLLGGQVVRVKLWTPAGRIVYSDEPRLIGRVYPLDEDERAALASGRVQAGPSDLSAPENRFERSQRKLLEVYLPVRTPAGNKLLVDLTPEAEALLFRAA